MDLSRENEFLTRLAQGVVNFDDEGVKAVAEQSLTEGLDPHKAVFEGLVKGMQEVGVLYERQEYFVPELLMCSDALNAGLNIFKPFMTNDKSNRRGQIVLGVVQGDVHDIGKDIVKILLESSGFLVHDLGSDVPLEKFVEEQERTNSEIVAISAMMTTTMAQMKDIIKAIKAKNPNVKFLIGGAPVTADIVKLFEADGYGKDASDALKEAIRIVESLKN
ncbi:MAG: cobalamin-binding protein [Peptococcaceae bacterium]|nr:cobalamin-binding protein [Peptococcaceae bacterium]